jgi:hypothetical protein
MVTAPRVVVAVVTQATAPEEMVTVCRRTMVMINEATDVAPGQRHCDTLDDAPSRAPPGQEHRKRARHSRMVHNVRRRQQLPWLE